VGRMVGMNSGQSADGMSGVDGGRSVGKWWVISRWNDGCEWWV